MSQPTDPKPRRSEKTAEQIPLEDKPTQLLVIPDSSLPPAPGTSERVVAERRLVRKLDFRLLPAIATIFILNYIDKTGITAARLKGFEKDLGLSDLQYSVILSIYYAVHCPAQIPSNMVRSRLTGLARPSVYIGTCVILWGLISALTGIATSYGQIIACRIFLALPEVQLLAPQHRPSLHSIDNRPASQELTLRASILYAGLEISNGFGSLMAAGIFSGMEGVRGIRAWRWYDIYSFSVTHNTRWMSPTERRLAQTRIAEDSGEADKDTENDTSFRGLKMALRDPMVLLFALTGVSGILGNSYGIFFPTLASTLGFNTTDTLLLAAYVYACPSSPPWVLATVLCCTNSWHAGRTGEFFFHISLWSCGTIIGMIIALCTMSVPVRYFSMFLMVSSSAAGGILLPWVANAVPRPPAKRAAAIAVVNGVLNLGGLIGSYTWRAEWGPRYHNSMIICIASLVLSMLGLFVIRQVLIRKNQQLDRDEAVALADMNSARVKDAAILEGITYEEATERRKRVRYLY
ncbi:major facilitator superfamily domain-containing protein [Mycena polygramma]|nr:major facilitator superfamily domain-containing protein [Mycena polygramma]